MFMLQYPSSGSLKWTTIDVESVLMLQNIKWNLNYTEYSSH